MFYAEQVQLVLESVEVARDSLGGHDSYAYVFHFFFFLLLFFVISIMS